MDLEWDEGCVGSNPLERRSIRVVEYPLGFVLCCLQHALCLSRKGTQISNFDCWGVRAGGARSTSENGQTLTTETQIENR